MNIFYFLWNGHTNLQKLIYKVNFHQSETLNRNSLTRIRAASTDKGNQPKPPMVAMNAEFALIYKTEHKKTF